MATLVFIPNPFEPYETETETIQPTNSIYSLLKTKDVNLDIYEPILYKNQNPIEYDCEVVEDDIIVYALMPIGGGEGGGNKALRTVLLVVVAIAAAYTGGAAAAAYGTGWGAVAGAAVGIAGSLLVNAVLPVQTAQLGDLGSGLGSYETSSTYGWDGGNITKEGYRIPVLYGTRRVTPPVLDSYIETIDNKQYLHVLYCVAWGELNSITDIQINGDPIEYFSGCSYETRLGTNRQAPIADFASVHAHKDIGRKININYTTTETDGNSVSTIWATLIFNKGLCSYSSTDGSIQYASVKLILEYSADGITWVRFGGDTQVIAYPTTFIRYSSESFFGFINEQTNELIPSLPSNAVLISGNGSIFDNYRWGIPETITYPYTTVTAATDTELRKVFSVSGLAKNKYRVRIKFYEAPPSSSLNRNECWFQFLEEGYDYTLVRPKKALLAIRSLATDQLQGNAPTVTCLATRSITNPADVCIDMLTNPLYGGNYPIDRVITSQFDTLRAYADELDMKVNVYFDQTSSLSSALDAISQMGFSKIVQFGSKFGSIIDKPNEIPVQGFLFNHGNIIKDSFSIQQAAIKDRANSVEVIYYDEDADYKQQTILVQQENYDYSGDDNKTSITLLACTSKADAQFYAERLLRGNRYLTLQGSFKASIDSINCQVGKITKITHSALLPDSISGRIVSMDENSVTLDVAVEMETGAQYAIEIRSNKTDNILTAQIQYQSGRNTTLYFVEPISEVSTKYSIYSFGKEGLTSRLVRIQAIDYASDTKRNIKWIEYNPSIYDVTKPVVVIDDASNLGVRGLRVSDDIKLKADGTIETVVALSWYGVTLKYNVWYRLHGEIAWTFIGTAVNSQYDIRNLTDGETYDIAVGTTINGAAIITYTVIGKTAPPPDIISLDVQNSFSSIKKLVWSYTPPLDFAGFEVRYCLGNTLDWSHGQKLHDGLLLSSPYNANLGGIAGVYTVMIKAVDTTGNYSVNPAYAVFNEGDADVVNLVEEQIYDLSTVEVSNMELVGGTLKVPLSAQLWATDRTAPLWSANKTAPLWGSSYPLGYAIFKYKAPSKTGKIKLTIETDGVTNIYYRVNDGVLWSLDKTAPLWDNDRTKPLWTVGEWIPYTGEFDISLSRYEFKVGYPTQNYQSVLSHFSVIQDVEDISEEFNNLHISASGTRLPITKTYSVIKSVPASVQSDGNGGVTYQVIDKDPVNGALVKVLNSAGAAVNGIIDAKVIGYYAG